ncbi:MAG TPA: hypothetical protein VFW05_00355 [Verrucomicrobiae bacterium]|nr:hypothetical protein [Verrucomicrobiae bacterium]
MPPAPNNAILAGQTIGKSFNLTHPVKFELYAAVNRGIHKSAVPIAGAGIPTIEHYWEDVPEFTGWGSVVGKYPDARQLLLKALLAVAS